MKALLIPFFVIGFKVLTFSQGFLERTAEKTANKVKQRAENRVDKGIDKALDKTEKGIEDSVKGEGKKKSDKSTPNRNEVTSDSSSPARATSENKANQNQSQSALKLYSKFDFVAGEKILAYEDFSQDAVGDFPANWNTNASGDIVTFNELDQHWFRFAPSGIYYPEFIGNLPENFTLEFDMVAHDLSEMKSGLKLFFVSEKDRNLRFDHHFNTSPQAGIDIHPSGNAGYTAIWVCDKSQSKILENDNPISRWKYGQSNRISIWRQKSRLRVYVNEVKAWDIPRAFLMDVDYAMLFATNLFGGEVQISNLRIAEGAPDTRNKLLTDGKIVSRGILFDVNSDRIKPESYGALQDIAKTLKEVTDVNIKIVGHTDTDGDDAKNLELSKRRAQAVRDALNKEFGIELSRMKVDGKGESEPIESNTTLTGKAMNRRVEFIKL